MFRKQFQIGLIHAAVAMTLVPITSTLNRVMIKELGILAILVAFLASLPYLFSPIQVAIGSLSDRYPLWRFRRTPYILFGLILCVAGVVLSPYAAYMIPVNFWAGIGLGVLAFGAWGMGYNFATVAYFSLATEISGEKGRSRQISVMFVIMILTIILTSIGLSRLLEPFSWDVLKQAFSWVGFLALGMGVLGIFRLETRLPDGAQGEGSTTPLPSEERYSIKTMLDAILGNRQVILFFCYLILMLAAILGQDILLEPFAAESFGLKVNETTRITSIWGGTFLVSLVITGFLEGRVAKITIARVGAWGGILAFCVISTSGILGSLTLFYLGVVLLGTATGLATVSNLSLMLDMTVQGNEGLYIGAWGMANAFSRLIGWWVSAIVRDVSNSFLANQVTGYVVVFFLEAGMLMASLVLLRFINVSAFQKRAKRISVIERAAIVNEG